MIGVIIVLVDVTERRALLDAEHDARVRADFLARAGTILDASLDYEETLGNVARIASRRSPTGAPSASSTTTGSCSEVAAAHVDAAQRAIGRELSRRYPPTRNARAARTGSRAPARRPTSARSPTR